MKCQKCGYCCTIPRSIPDKEVLAISALTRESFEEAKKKLRDYPCGYLKNNRCEINEIKPITCRWYPGPDAKCKAYKELADKVYQPGLMSRIGNEPELVELYTTLLITGDKEIALKLIELLDIKL